MSKSAKKTASEKPAKSLLRAAFEAAERGDVFTARRLAKAVVAGTVGADEVHEAATVAEALSTDELQVDAQPRTVAQALLRRTAVPLKSYAFALLALGVWVLLVLLAHARYGA